MYNYYESKTLSQTEDGSRKDSIVEVGVRVEPIGGGLIVMMLSGGASSGAVAGGGVHVGVDVERQVDVGAVGDCAGAGSGDAPDAVDAGEHGNSTPVINFLFLFIWRVLATKESSHIIVSQVAKCAQLAEGIT